jgi:hypothetical protein
MTLIKAHQHVKCLEGVYEPCWGVLVALLYAFTEFIELSSIVLVFNTSDYDYFKKKKKKKKFKFITFF